VASNRSRETAYGDVIAGLLDVRVDPASQRFDAEIAAAEEEGRIDPQTAKVLRWWQRESIRGLVDHARTVVPATLVALEQSAVGAGAETEASSRSWARAVGDDFVADPVVDLTARAGTVQAATVHPDPVHSDSAHADPVPPPADLADHRRRLLVAGLTRVSNDH